MDLSDLANLGDGSRYPLTVSSICPRNLPAELSDDIREW